LQLRLQDSGKESSNSTVGTLQAVQVCSSGWLLIAG
jgi:hypothetical protein